jgi:ABC-type branched-subunit amino acid transport system permease subunit
VQPDVPHQGLLARHPLLFYVLIAYLGTWIVWLPFLLSADGLGLMAFSSPLPLVVMGGLGTFTGPFLGAFVMTGVTEGGRAYAACFARWCCGGWGFGGTC